MAMQLHAAALREVEPTLRFMLCWIALEAIGSPLRRRLHRARKDRHWGLKALAEAHGDSAELIDDAYELRNDLFHVRGGVDARMIPARAHDIGDRLEPLIAPGLLVLLDRAADAGHLPATAASAHPVQFVLTASVRGNPSAWGPDSHPHVELDFEVVPLGVADDGSIDFKTPTTITIRNCEAMTPHSIEIRGPFGPNVGRMALDEIELASRSSD
jgi:uncharacterized membrane protein